jgi:tetratricopeptide (TPR) repeat protein
MRRLGTFALVACLAAAAPSGAAADPTSPANVAAAQRHYDKARALYSQGAYREALAEFEAAHSLDPNAKDLVFNLGVVHEKLADIDDALKWFRLFLTMDLTQKERDKGEAYVRRLEGAKKEFDERQAQQQAAASAASASTSATAPPPASTQEPPPPPKGRVDAATITAAGISVAALGFGIFMGVRAKSDQPPSNFITGRDGTYPDYVNRQTNAHHEAVFADVGFGVALVAAAAAAYLYFARPKAASPATTGSTTVSALPLAGGGGALLLRGTF